MIPLGIAKNQRITYLLIKKEGVNPLLQFHDIPLDRDLVATEPLDCVIDS